MTTPATRSPRQESFESLEAQRVAADTTDALVCVLTDYGSNAVAVDTAVAPVIDGITELAAGGKRVRALLCHYGWRAANADPSDLVMRLMIRNVGVSLELFHLGALIHDDIMDGATTRRGVPTIHSRIAESVNEGDSGAASRFGHSAAILAGDLCFGWAAGTFSSSVAAHEKSGRAFAMFDAMRSELMVGQYLDIASELQPDRPGLDRALKITRLKTARYSVEFPLQIGAFLGGAPDETRARLSVFAMAIGEAYQLRDDLLGVFGSSADTGKSAEEDLVNAKHTALWCEARSRASAVQLVELELLARGDTSASRIEAVRNVMIDTGAAARIEQLIDLRYAVAMDTLAKIPDAPHALSVLASELAYRDR
jgi:geranylgeranyl diphosphate synthase type I